MLEKEIAKMLRKLGLDVKEVRVTDVRDHGLYDYSTVFLEVVTPDTVLSARLPVARSVRDRVLDDHLTLQ